MNDRLAVEPILKRLKDLSDSVVIELSPEKPTIEKIESLGPLAWAPPQAPSWTLPDSEGKACTVPQAGTTGRRS